MNPSKWKIQKEIPLTVIIIIMVWIVAGIVGWTNMDNRVDNNKAEIIDIDDSVSKMDEKIDDIMWHFGIERRDRNRRG